MVEMNVCGNTGCRHYNETFLSHCQSYAVIAVATCEDSQWVPASEVDPERDLKMCEPGAKLADGKMTPQEFDTLLQQWLDRIERVLGHKAGEYAQNGDRLFNFRQAAQINDQTMSQALWGMATKHLVSVMDLVEGRLEPTPAIVHEKCTDLVNYIILLSAVLLEDNFSENKGE